MAKPRVRRRGKVCSVVRHSQLGRFFLEGRFTPCTPALSPVPYSSSRSTQSLTPWCRFRPAHLIASSLPLTAMFCQSKYLISREAATARAKSYPPPLQPPCGDFSCLRPPFPSPSPLIPPPLALDLCAIY